MTYFDVSYVVRLYFEDPGWKKVRALAVRSSIACGLHGQAEMAAAFHRKVREGVVSAAQLRHVQGQFALDCSESAYRWLPLSPAVSARVTESYAMLPRTVFLRSGSAVIIPSRGAGARKWPGKFTAGPSGSR